VDSRSSVEWNASPPRAGLFYLPVLGDAFALHSMFQSLTMGPMVGSKAPFDMRAYSRALADHKELIGGDAHRLVPGGAVHGGYLRIVAVGAQRASISRRRVKIPSRVARRPRTRGKRYRWYPGHIRISAAARGRPGARRRTV
jgi:hypothetical protein